MAAPFLFSGKRVLVDITVSSVSPGATHRTPVTGQITDATGSSGITQIGSGQAITTTALSGLYGDLTDLILISPVNADGTYPDAFVWPIVDGIDLSHYIRLDASYERNMMPNPGNTEGRRHVSLGIPYRDAVSKKMQNLPFKVTGLKASREYRFAVYSSTGWSNPAVPLRIIGLGDLLNDQALDQVASQGYSGQFNDQVPNFAAYSGTHQLPGGQLSAKTWTALPGGSAQGSLKIYRFFREAINRIATPASTPFMLSNQNVVGGAQGNVGDAEDLGYDHSLGDKYLRVVECGIRPGANQLAWGVKVDDTILPGDTPNGTPVTRGVNPYAYGLVQPQRAESGLYFTLPKTPFPVVAYKNKLVFFIVANGTAIAASDASVALGGIWVEQSQ